MSEALLRCKLQGIIVAVRPRAQLRHGAKSRVRWLAVGKWRKTAAAHGLVTVHLCLVRLVHCARAHILCAKIDSRSDLALQPQAPLHEVGRMQLAIRNRGDGYRLQTSIR